MWLGHRGMYVQPLPRAVTWKPLSQHAIMVYLITQLNVTDSGTINMEQRYWEHWKSHKEGRESRLSLRELKGTEILTVPLSIHVEIII